MNEKIVITISETGISFEHFRDGVKWLSKIFPTYKFDKYKHQFIMEFVRELHNQILDRGFTYRSKSDEHLNVNIIEYYRSDDDPISEEIQMLWYSRLNNYFGEGSERHWK